MVDWGKKFDEQFGTGEFVSGYRKDVISFIYKTLEEQEKKLRAEFDNMTQKDFDAELEEYVYGKLKYQQKINNEVLADKCDEMDKMAERLRLIKDEVFNAMCSIPPSSLLNQEPIKVSVLKEFAKKICELQKKT